MVEQSPLVNFKGEPCWVSPTKQWHQCSPKRKARLRAAWSTGNLRWKLDPEQQVIYDQVYASHGRVKTSFERQYFLDLSRQNGKDFLLSTFGIEGALRHREFIRIVYAAPTKEMVHNILKPTISNIFQDCPPELLPNEIASGTFLTTAQKLTWPWGATIQLVGVDLHPD